LGARKLTSDVTEVHIEVFTHGLILFELE